MFRFCGRQVGLAAMVLFLVADMAWAGSRPPFDGSYSLSDVDENEIEVSLQFTVSVTNLSGGEVHYGVLRVLRDEESAEPAEPYTRFERISIPIGGTVRLSRGLILSPAEYEAWAAGRPLPAAIECVDENGVPRTTSIDLNYAPEQPDN